MATHNGVVVTKTTELAMEVNCNEVIQVAKCSARNMPDKIPFSKLAEVIFRHSGPCLINAIGTRTKLAITSRAAAMVMEEASAWAKRMKMDAVETKRIPAPVAIRGRYVVEGSCWLLMDINCNRYPLLDKAATQYYNLISCVTTQHAGEYGAPSLQQ